MTEKCFADIVINKERLSDGSDVYVAHCSNLGITSQGETTEEAMKNIREAIELYLEERPEAYSELTSSIEPPIFSVIELVRNAKTSNIVR